LSVFHSQKEKRWNGGMRGSVPSPGLFNSFTKNLVLNLSIFTSFTSKNYVGKRGTCKYVREIEEMVRQCIYCSQQ